MTARETGKGLTPAEAAAALPPLTDKQVARVASLLAPYAEPDQ